MNILGVDELSGDAPLMEAGLDSLWLGASGFSVCFLVDWKVSFRSTKSSTSFV